MFESSFIFLLFWPLCFMDRSLSSVQKWRAMMAEIQVFLEQSKNQFSHSKEKRKTSSCVFAITIDDGKERKMISRCASKVKIFKFCRKWCARLFFWFVDKCLKQCVEFFEVTFFTLWRNFWTLGKALEERVHKGTRTGTRSWKWGPREERVPDFKKGTRQESNTKNQRTRSFCVPIFNIKLQNTKICKITYKNTLLRRNQ